MTKGGRSLFGYIKACLIHKRAGENVVLEFCSEILLGGSWVVISMAIGPLLWVITIVTLYLIYNPT